MKAKLLQLHYIPQVYAYSAVVSNITDPGGFFAVQVTVPIALCG